MPNKAFNQLLGLATEIEEDFDPEVLEAYAAYCRKHFDDIFEFCAEALNEPGEAPVIGQGLYVAKTLYVNTIVQLLVHPKILHKVRAEACLDQLSDLDEFLNRFAKMEDPHDIFYD
jgi:hypothetical protein